MDNISIQTPVIAPAELPRKKRKYTKSPDGKPKILGPFKDGYLLEEFHRQLDALNDSDAYPFKLTHKQFFSHLLKINDRHFRRVV
jgi:hypothetical protein